MHRLQAQEANNIHKSPNTARKSLLPQPKLQQLVPIRNSQGSTKLKNQNQKKLLQSCQSSTKSCTLCPFNKTQLQPHQLHNFMMTGLASKYAGMQDEYINIKVVNDLIYNEQTHMVSVFKDYLINDDINEFFKRNYF